MQWLKAMPDKFTDILTYSLSLALAAGVIVFAAHKVVVLNGMENPPANLGLNFPAPRRKVIMEGGDQLATRSLPPAAEAAGSGTPPAGGLHAYELLAVVDKVAFVAVAGEQGPTLVPVTVGSRLPGGPVVSAIRRQGGRWTLLAGNLTLEQPSLPPGQ